MATLRFNIQNVRGLHLILLALDEFDDLATCKTGAELKKKIAEMEDAEVDIILYAIREVAVVLENLPDLALTVAAEVCTEKRQTG